jgi:pimeloyl-ACP methyl ester carboxylesterase
MTTSANRAAERVEVEIPVRLTPNDREPKEHVFAVVAAPDVPEGRTVQLLVHGSTLSHRYWDCPIRRETYSYVDRATAAGYVTVSIDRIGVGRSSRPPGDEVTLASNAFVLHQVIEQLRAGDITGAPAPAVALVGHSLGSIVSVTTAGRFGGVDALVVHGFLHEVAPGGAEQLFASLVPADEHEKFRGHGLPAGYMAMRRGARGQFYESATSQPEVIEWDEEASETTTTGEAATYPEFFEPNGPASQVSAPLLICMGQRDSYFCGPELACDTEADILRREASFYPSSRCLSGHVLANSGHNGTLHLSAPRLHDVTLEWLDRHVGSEGRPVRACERCAPGGAQV